MKKIVLFSILLFSVYSSLFSQNLKWGKDVERYVLENQLQNGCGMIPTSLFKPYLNGKTKGDDAKMECEGVITVIETDGDDYIFSVEYKKTIFYLQTIDDVVAVKGSQVVREEKVVEQEDEEEDGVEIKKVGKDKNGVDWGF